MEFKSDISENTTEIHKASEDTVLKDKTSNNEPTKDESSVYEHLPYISSRRIIQGVHLQFIDIAREIVADQCIKTIPLMREFHLQKSDLEQIIQELKNANIIGQYDNILVNSVELEKFLDIYDPTMFNCKHTVFDKNVFLNIGEIIFDKGVESVYESMHEDELLDYLDIMERLAIISYNSQYNNYDIITSKEAFYKICECIPFSFSNQYYESQETDYQDKNFDAMSGLEFERYCGYLLEKNNFSEIKITQASGNHGIDIITEKDGVTYAIQCTCHSNNISNTAIQQAHAGKSLYHKDLAVVMTNRYFTKQAQEEAEQLGVKLWDRDKILELKETIHKQQST